MEYYARSYAIDGVMWGAERQGPLGNSLGAFHNGAHSEPGKVTCFCGYCQAKAKQPGISVERARQRYMALEKFVRTGCAGTRPRDGYFVASGGFCWSIPKFSPGRCRGRAVCASTTRPFYERAKSVRPEVQVGWLIWHNVSFSPFYRAEQDYTELARYSDYIKRILYNDCAGDRMGTYMDSVA